MVNSRFLWLVKKLFHEDTRELSRVSCHLLYVLIREWMMSFLLWTAALWNTVQTSGGRKRNSCFKMEKNPTLLTPFVQKINRSFFPDLLFYLHVAWMCLRTFWNFFLLYLISLLLWQLASVKEKRSSFSLLYSPMLRSRTFLVWKECHFGWWGLCHFRYVGYQVMSRHKRF